MTARHSSALEHRNTQHGSIYNSTQRSATFNVRTHNYVAAFYHAFTVGTTICIVSTAKNRESQKGFNMLSYKQYSSDENAYLST